MVSRSSSCTLAQLDSIKSGLSQNNTWLPSSSFARSSHSLLTKDLAIGIKSSAITSLRPNSFKVATRGNKTGKSRNYTALKNFQSLDFPLPSRCTFDPQTFIEAMNMIENTGVAQGRQREEVRSAEEEKGHLQSLNSLLRVIKILKERIRTLERQVYYFKAQYHCANKRCAELQKGFNLANSPLMKLNTQLFKTTPKLLSDQDSFPSQFKLADSPHKIDRKITFSHSKGEFRNTIFKKREEPQKVIKELRALVADNEDYIIRMKQALENHMKKIKELESTNKRVEDDSVKFRNHSLKLEEEVQKLKTQVTHLLGYKSEVEVLREKNFLLNQQKQVRDKEHEEELEKVRKECDMNMVEWEESRPQSKFKSSRKPSQKKYKGKNSNYS